MRFLVASASALLGLALLLPPAAALPVSVGDEDTVLVTVGPLAGGHDVRVTGEVPFHFVFGVWCLPIGAGAGCIYYGSGPMWGGCGVSAAPSAFVGCGDIRVGYALVRAGASGACLEYRLNPVGPEQRVCAP